MNSNKQTGTGILPSLARIPVPVVSDVYSFQSDRRLFHIQYLIFLHLSSILLIFFFPF